MNYCTNCSEIVNAKKCTHCGNKKLREVEENDYCHFATLDSLQAGMFKPILEENNIDVIITPYYGALVTKSSIGNSSYKKLFVKYKHIQNATSLYKTYFNN